MCVMGVHGLPVNLGNRRGPGNFDIADSPAVHVCVSQSKRLRREDRFF